MPVRWCNWRLKIDIGMHAYLSGARVGQMGHIFFVTGV